MRRSLFARSARFGWTMTFLLFVGLSLLLAGCDDGGVEPDPDPTITALAADTPELSTLVTALQAAGLDDDLQGDGPFTVFAPVNSAFDDLDTNALVDDGDLLETVLTYHVVPNDALASGDLSDGQTLTTLQGGTLTITTDNGGVQVNGIPVSTADVQASNGIVHLIDGVLLDPANAVQRASITPAFSILVDLVGRANLAATLSGPGPDGEDGLTIFAPTNTAFLAALDANDNDVIDDSEIPSNAGDILAYHVLDDVFFAADVPTSNTAVPTLEGSDVTVVRDGSNVTVNPGTSAEASVIVPNVGVSNGVIHGIDTVLQIPASN